GVAGPLAPPDLTAIPLAQVLPGAPGKRALTFAADVFHGDDLVLRAAFPHVVEAVRAVRSPRRLEREQARIDSSLRSDRPRADPQVVIHVDEVPLHRVARSVAAVVGPRHARTGLVIVLE